MDFAPFEQTVLNIQPEPGRMDELHLYHGSRCNRACSVCCVDGAPDGDHTPFSEEVLRAAVGIVARRGSLKIYGGEPTLDAEGLLRAVRTIRTLGFQGAITVFSNGLRPRVLLSLLEEDRMSYVVLNYAIATGQGEELPPPNARQMLTTFDRDHPGRIYLSHALSVPVGRFRRASVRDPAPGFLKPTCVRCWPVLTSSGRYHACPFAVAHDFPQYRLGMAQDDPSFVQNNFRVFKEWISLSVEPEAERVGRHPCQVCCRPDVPHPKPKLSHTRGTGRTLGSFIQAVSSV